MEVNYRWKKHYKTAKYPIRQPRWLTWLIWFLSKCALIGKKYRLETIDMDGLEPPYIIFSNHMAFIDFELAAMVTYPNKVNNVVNIDGYHMMPWLLTWIGSICTRKFTNDFRLSAASPSSPVTKNWSEIPEPAAPNCVSARKSN